MRKTEIKKIEKNIAITIVLTGLMFFAVSMNVTANDISAETVFRQLNEARTLAGLAPLAQNDRLNEAAQAKLQDMLDNNYFEHTSPSGIEPWFWFGKSRYIYTYAGENLAMDFRTAEAEQAAWMKSPTHRENILNVNFQEVGIAVRQGMINGHATTIAVQEFGARKDFPIFARGSETSNGKILGAEDFNLASIGSKFDATFVEGINNQFAAGPISGWTLILFGIAMSTMGVTAVYLAFDIYKIRKAEKLAQELYHHDVYHISDAEYAKVLDMLAAKSMRLKHHHS